MGPAAFDRLYEGCTAEPGPGMHTQVVIGSILGRQLNQYRTETRRRAQHITSIGPWQELLGVSAR